MLQIACKKAQRCTKKDYLPRGEVVLNNIFVVYYSNHKLRNSIGPPSL